MDNDLMARRLRPPSQPTAVTGQSSPASSPWDVSLTSEGDFAPPHPGIPQPDPSFAPPDPAARADVPWDRPAPEAWPPAEDYTAPVEPAPTWPVQTGAPDNAPQTNWPAADQLNEAPWDRPAASEDAPWQDPDDAFAPVVGDVPGPVAWASWNGNDNANGNGHLNANGDGHASTQASEQMWVSAQSDRPSGDDALATSNSYPHWPAEDNLSVAPPHSPGAVTSEDSPSATPPWAIPAPEATAPEPTSPEAAEQEPFAPDFVAPEPPAEFAPGPEAQLEPQGQPEPHPEPQFESHPESELAPATLEPATPEPATPEPAAPEPAAPQSAAPQPAAPSVPSTPSLELTTPPNTQIVAITPIGTPENMVLRIELAIVDASQSADPADTAKRVGPDADERRADVEPANAGSGAPMPEPAYIWGAPPPAAPIQPQQPQQYAPPPSSWLPAPQQPQTQQRPQQLDWGLPLIGGHEPPVGGQPAPWSTPQPQQSHQMSSAPHWPPQRQQPPNPSATPWQQPEHQYSWPPQLQDPPNPSAALWQQPEQQYNWPPQPQDPLALMPAAPQHPQRAPQMAPPVASAPAVGSTVQAGAVAARQADLWFLDDQPAAATIANDEVVTEGKSNSVLTAGLTIGFALLVIVLVLVFIQLMTSLLR